MKYKILPAHLFFPCWMYQHQKRIRQVMGWRPEFKGMDVDDIRDFTDAAVWIFNHDPKMVEDKHN